MGTSCSSFRPLVSSSENIWFFTDIEGDIDHFLKLMHHSPALTVNEFDEYEVRQDWQVVFGGDCCDHGCGDIQIIHTLLSLKLKFPDQVHLILGNRDVNKLRLPFELSDYALQSFPHLYWVKEEGTCVADQEHSRPERLKWLLLHSFGAPKAFEGRRVTMSSDEEVLTSFLKQLDPVNGMFTTYLENGCIVKRIGNKIFVHGSITRENLFFIPDPASLSRANISLLNNWIDAMNTFVHKEMERYRKDTHAFLVMLNETSLSSGDKDELLWTSKGVYAHPQPGSGLVQLGMSHLGSGNPNKTVIYGNYLFKKPEESVSFYLKENGVDFVITGHQPIGDVAFVQKCLGVYYVSGDISYAGNVLWNPSGDEDESSWKPYQEESQKSTRGSFAVCNVVLTPDKVRIYGILSNEYFYDFFVPDEESLIGTEIKDSWYVTAINVQRKETEPRFILLTKYEGYKCKNRLVSRELFFELLVAK